MRDHVEAMGGVVVAEGKERRMHGGCCGAWKAEGEDLHWYFSGGTRWVLVHGVCSGLKAGLQGDLLVRSPWYLSLQWFWIREVTFVRAVCVEEALCDDT